MYYRDPTGRMRFLPAAWTSMAAPDPFVHVAAGRAYFRLEDLIRLQERLKQLQGMNARDGAPDVKETMPCKRNNVVVDETQPKIGNALCNATHGNY